MYNIHDCSDNKINDLNYIKEKFETIYKNISYIENLVNENDVLRITLKTYYKDLNESSIDRIKEDINDKVSKEKLDFIKSFTEELENNFQYLKYFLDDEKNNLYIHSIINLGINIDIYPFIVGIYRFGINEDDKKKLIESLENLLIRIKLIGSRANIISRIKDKYEQFIEEGDINPIIDRINELKNTTDWRWAYWNNDRLIENIEYVSHEYAKFILWKYEISLQTGYEIRNLRYDSKKINLEHIAPKKEPTTKPHGYGKYDDDFKNLIHSLGNYILLNESHNKSLSNATFPNKYKSYKDGDLRQQREIIDMTSKNGTWGKKQIRDRNKKIIKFIMDYYK